MVGKAKPRFLDPFEKAILIEGGKVKVFLHGKLHREYQWIDDHCTCPNASIHDLMEDPCEHERVWEHHDYLEEVTVMSHDDVPVKIVEILNAGQSACITVKTGWDGVRLAVVHEGAMVLVLSD